MLRIDPRISADLKLQARPIGIGLACTTLAAGLYTYTIPLTKKATDAVGQIADNIGPHGDAAVRTAAMHSLQVTCFTVVIVFALRYFLVRSQLYYFAEAANKLSANLRTRLFSKLMRLPVGYFNDRRTGSIQSVLTNDVNVYQNAIGVIQDSIQGPIKAVGALGYIVWRQPTLVPFTMVLIAVMVWFVQSNSRKMKIAQADVQANLAELTASADEALQGNRVIKAFGAEAQADANYRIIIDRTLNSQLRAAGILSRLRPLVDFIGASALAGVLFVAGLLAAKGEVTVGDITALALGMDIINQGFKNMASLGSTLASVTAASDRIYGQVLDVTEESHEHGGVIVPEKLLGRIEFRNVSFTYPDGTCALRNVSFVIEPGSSLALVGPSGAGKTTIADLLLRFYEPTEGAIYIDGVPLSDINTSWWRSHIGVVPQQTFLFAGPIEDNVRMGNPLASAEDVKDAMRSAHAEEFTAEFVSRSNANLGERGMKLSGGQMQRVAIARALVRRPSILLLDEATSALDARSEKVVTEALNEVMQHRTTLMIAHRLTTAARADCILFLKSGQVAEQGSHHELLAAKGDYAALFRLFSEGVLDGTLI